jgi:hypothetical protein
MARVTVALVVACSLAAAAPAARAAGGCEVPKDAKLRARTAEAVVYRNEDHVAACLESTGRTVFLKHVDGPGEGSAERVGAIALAGPLLAFADASNTAYGQSARVRLLDLRRPRRQVYAGQAGSFGDPVAVPQLLLTRDGWLAYSSPGGQVWIRDALGLRKVGDSPSLDPRSLRREGGDVTWSEGGDARTAHIQGPGRCDVRWHDRVRRRGSGFLMYEVRNSGPEARVFACRRRTGERQLLQVEDRSIEHPDVAHNYRIAGRFAAWSRDYEDHYGNQFEWVNVWDLERRQIARTTRIAEAYPEDSRELAVASIALSPAGDVAWMLINANDSFGGTVGARDSCGVRTFEDGSAVDRHSLRLHGDVVSWKHQDSVQQVRLRSPAEC